MNFWFGLAYLAGYIERRPIIRAFTVVRILRISAVCGFAAFLPTQAAWATTWVFSRGRMYYSKAWEDTRVWGGSTPRSIIITRLKYIPLFTWYFGTHPNVKKKKASRTRPTLTRQIVLRLSHCIRRPCLRASTVAVRNWALDTLGIGEQGWGGILVLAQGYVQIFYRNIFL